MKILEDYSNAVMLSTKVMDKAVSDLNDVIDMKDTSNPVRQSVRYAFLLNHDYYTSAIQALASGQIFSAMAMTRIGLEIISDMLYIHDFQEQNGDQEVYARKYVSSINAYLSEYLKSTKTTLETGELNEALLNRMGSWSSRTVYQRMELIGPGILTMYNMMSYGTHADPSLLLYKYIPGYAETQKRITATLNLFNAETILQFLNSYETEFTIDQVELAQLSELLSKRNTY